jgi:hypothetical protein
LPEAVGYHVIVKPLRYRTEPRLSALTEFDDRTITLQVPQPFLPFGEIVPYGAKRMPGEGMRFVPISAGVSFRTPAEVLRFLYCHEWYHWFLYEIRKKGWRSETACDRFALRNYRRRRVTMADARAALRRERDGEPATLAPARAARAPARSRQRAAQQALPGMDPMAKEGDGRRRA